VADTLFAAAIRAQGLEELISGSERVYFVQGINQTAKRYATIARKLLTRPLDGGLSFAPDGSHRVDPRRTALAVGREEVSPTLQLFAAKERETQETILLAFEALFYIWNGLD
jgi:hypothetical protein